MRKRDKMGGIILFKILSDRVDWFITRFVFVLFSVLTVVVTAQIIARVFFEALSWSEELSRYLLAWGTFFGASMGFKRGSHIGITFIIDLLRPRLRQVASLFTYTLSIAFFIIGMTYGFRMISQQVYQTSPAMGLSMSIVYLAIPLSFAIMVIHTVADLIHEIALLMGRRHG